MVLKKLEMGSLGWGGGQCGVSQELVSQTRDGLGPWNKQEKSSRLARLNIPFPF